MKLLKSNIWLAFLCLPFLSFSQLTVTTNGVASTLAQTIAGNGVTVSNATLNCGGVASGIFSYTGANLGIPSGILLTTGAATDAANPGTYFCNVLNGNNFSDPDLISIEPQAINDVCILQFDFVPICNSLSITFVFGSEEYPNFVGSFNDGFGIFLTGPNPGGGNYTAQNIGTLPGGTPVSINNVNAGTNSAYFHDNYTTPNNDIAYDGYTIPVTSVTPVKPCSTYHMKIAIADAVDEAYDSGVFVGSNAVTCQNAPTITASSTPTGCGGNTGSATATVTNYTGAVTYQWSPGGQTTASVNGLSAGSYTCVVGLQLSCGNITQTVTTVVANTGSTLNVNATSTNPKCNNGTNGTATVTVNGGTAPYTYSWNTTPVQTTVTASNLGAGTFVVTVTDNGGCVSTATVTLVNPAPIVASVTTTPTTCSGSNGSAGATVASGGTGPFSYWWNSTPVQTTQVATNLASGNYTVVITDANSCTVTASGVVAQQNGGWTLTASTATNVTCFGRSNGAATFTINNPGVNVFTYLWSTTPPQNTQSANNIPAGTYTCAVSDNNGCTQNVSVTITQPSQLAVTTFPAPTICTASVGTATASVAGGTTPYAYSWNSTPVQTSSVANNLPQGTVLVTVTDANGCIVSAPATIATVNQTIQITSTIIPSKCGGPSGGVNLSAVNGGTAPYTYNWNCAPVQTTQNLTNVGPGNYTLTIVDKNGCTNNFPEVVSITLGLPLTISSTPDVCNSRIGSATVIANGNAPYQYVWNTTPPKITQTIGNLPVGNYFVVVTDNFGCKDSTSVSVSNVNETLSSTFYTNPDGEIYTQEPVTISVGMNSGWVLDSAFLSDGNVHFSSNNIIHTFTHYGDYYVDYYFTSVHGCRDSIIYPIKVTDFMTLYIPNAFSPNGDGMNDSFKAQGTFIKTFEMSVYDRWGKLVIKMDDVNKSWDGVYHGEDAPQDTYVYKGTASDIFGRHISFQGQINLVR
ncbi:MAG TPA: choice-of-anchor L domain-containing protein [Bacteroidia bacterium]|nr:choice-of-anchor L domain-containing protein [Bacteroidia bacterium]